MSCVIVLVILNHLDCRTAIFHDVRIRYRPEIDLSSRVFIILFMTAIMLAPLKPQFLKVLLYHAWY